MDEIEVLKRQVEEYKTKLTEANENHKFIKEIYEAGKAVAWREFIKIETVKEKINDLNLQKIEQLIAKNKRLQDELVSVKAEFANSLCCVIYGLRCLVVNKIYVGSTKNYEIRKSTHLSDLRNGTHQNDGLLAAFKERGEDQFIFEILELCKLSNRFEKEQLWIEKYNALDPKYGFNLTVATADKPRELIRMPSKETIPMDVDSIRQRLVAGRNPELHGDVGERLKPAVC